MLPINGMIPVTIGGWEDISHSNNQIRILVVPSLVANPLVRLSQVAQARRASLHLRMASEQSCSTL